MIKIVEIFLRVLSHLAWGRFYEDFSLTNALSSMHAEGVTARASGVVFNDGTGPVGVYIVRYLTIEKENLDGRWN